MTRRRALRVTLTAILVVASVAFALWPGRPQQARVLGRLSGDASEVVLMMASCNATLSFRVYESEEAVAVIVWKWYDTRDDCADLVRIPLESPLGDRVLFDLSSWDVVERVFRTDG
jgi:hypothetical protein